MDLDAFLSPGLYPVFLADGEEKKEPWAHFLRRSGRRGSWLAKNSVNSSETLLISMQFPGYALESDGSLIYHPQTKATVVLAGRVKACRLHIGGEFYVLSFESLVRVLE
ncbi:MAG: hypothetical protein LBV23_02355 [Deltaproteobacteria bacterium]|jgi:hypothetical protein|nr:hypothetical protein [Deltaproteobacteria bacterium]